MKIFGKRKSSKATDESPGTPNTNNEISSSTNKKELDESDVEDENVASYFASSEPLTGSLKKKKKKVKPANQQPNGDDIQALLVSNNMLMYECCDFYEYIIYYMLTKLSTFVFSYQ